MIMSSPSHPGTPFRLLQLTDTHLFGQSDGKLLGLPTHISLGRIVDRILARSTRPDLILLTGDLSQDGSAESYDQLSTLLAPLKLPTYWLPGNHDSVETMTRSLSSPIFQAEKRFVSQGWQFILLNSQIPGEVSGRLSAATLGDLTRQLEQNNQPTTIAFHHPPVHLQSAWLDNSALQNPDELFAVIDRFPQVKLVLFGHIHQEICQKRQGVTYLSCPSTCIQFAQGRDTFALDIEHHPGFRELELFSDGTWNSQVHRVNVHLQPNLGSTGY
jgi:3',5'-cyclic-AMP phosphodiesterase